MLAFVGAMKMQRCSFRSVFIVALFASISAIPIDTAFAQQGRAPGSGSSTGNMTGDVVLATASEWGGQGGAYTCDQWKAYLGRMFNLADTKHRGFIDAKDFQIVKRSSKVFATADFGYFDEGGKGRVTREEFVNQTSPFFLKYDRKGTCRVTSADIAAAGKPAQSQPSPLGVLKGGGMGGGMGGMR
jgi:EF-hand domain pair